MRNHYSNNNRVIAIIVCYNSEVKNLVALFTALLPQVASAIVVNNSFSSVISTLIADWENIECLQMSDNVGIAAAQNIGVERAEKMGADFVLFLDQDSIPSYSMVAELLDAIRRTEGSVAAAGPAIIDRRTRQPYYFIREYKSHPRKWVPTIEKKGALIEVAILASSGSLVPLNILKKIGGMRAYYFIDHVDTEWCFRARAAGCKLIGVPHSTLEHQFGDAVKEIWLFGRRRIIYHAPLRNYYDVRNTLLMFKEVTMSIHWKIYFIQRLFRLGYFVVFDRERLLRIRLIALGLFHGIKSISGRL